jgi:hypothetical protein
LKKGEVNAAKLTSLVASVYVTIEEPHHPIWYLDAEREGGPVVWNFNGGEREAIVSRSSAFSQRWDSISPM